MLIKGIKKFHKNAHCVRLNSIPKYIGQPIHTSQIKFTIATL